MKSVIITLLYLAITISGTLAQDIKEGDNTNHFFIETPGVTGSFSIKYEKFVKNNITIRIGIGASAKQTSSSEGSIQAIGFLFPVLANYLIGSEKHALELGLGAQFLFGIYQVSLREELLDQRSGLIPIPSGTIGYRFLPKNKGFTFKVGTMPIFYGKKAGAVLTGENIKNQGIPNIPVMSGTGLGFHYGIGIGYRF
jgi:hypothetical protein